MLIDFPWTAIAEFYFALFPSNYSNRYQIIPTKQQACEFEKNKSQSNIHVYRVQIKTQANILGGDARPVVERVLVTCDEPKVEIVKESKP